MAVTTTTPQSDRCKTRYPIVLLHGAGYRDRKHPNYWGRVPKALAMEGATIFHGQQDAWATVQQNAKLLKKRIQQIMNQTGTDKVNLIAHSKGGLEARYLITHCGMAKHVASLTTLSTPHHGSVAMDQIATLSEPYFLVYGFIIDWISRLLGDESPDFYRASRQLSASFSAIFNEKTPNMPGVYYQSFTSVLNTPLSDLTYWLSFPFVRFYEGENDGLISVESAKWGNFRGALRPSGWRGISHSDIVDLSRMNLPGFDARKFYVKMVEELKSMGF